MHMADALVSPAVGGALWAATGVTAVYCAKKVRDDLDESKVPLMGVAGAFVFAAQMLNFTIPGTGSSGHLGGGLLLAALLGPHAAFLVISSVLGIQALFFADGGLLALGANIFNLGFFPAFIAYPLVFRTIAGRAPGPRRSAVASIAAGVVGLQLGALGVVLETTFSGVSELPFAAFATMMLPIHLAIGLVEGLVTAGVLAFIRAAQPEILERASSGTQLRGVTTRPVIVGLLAAALISGGALSWFASGNADGLEWSMTGVAGAPEVEGRAGGTAHQLSSGVQDRVSLLPDYDLPGEPRGSEAPGTASGGPDIDAGTSLAGIVGAVLTLGVTAGIALALRRRSGRRVPPPGMAP